MERLMRFVSRIILYVGIVSGFVWLAEAAGVNYLAGLGVGIGVAFAVGILFGSILYRK